MIGIFLGGVLGGAWLGLMAAVALRWARKERRLPLWPIGTGVMLGLLGTLLRLQ